MIYAQEPCVEFANNFEGKLIFSLQKTFQIEFTKMRKTKLIGKFPSFRIIPFPFYPSSLVIVFRRTARSGRRHVKKFKLKVIMSKFRKLQKITPTFKLAGRNNPKSSSSDRTQGLRSSFARFTF